jgi:hypothetical protein
MPPTGYQFFPHFFPLDLRQQAPGGATGETLPILGAHLDGVDEAICTGTNAGAGATPSWPVRASRRHVNTKLLATLFRRATVEGCNYWVEGVQPRGLSAPDDT